MGYTHYFRYKGAVKASKWAAICRDVRRVVDVASDSIPLAVEIGGFDVEGGGRVDVNGVGADSHENLYLTPAAESLEFGFCKTARKPYDVVVTAALLCFAKHLPGFAISSDGDRGDWDAGVALCAKAGVFEGEGVPSLDRMLRGVESAAARAERVAKYRTSIGAPSTATLKKAGLL